MQTIFHRAQLRGLIEQHPEASIDATGLDSQFVSRHYLLRQGKRTKRYRDWTKLTIVCHNASHLIAGAVVSVAPCNDSPDLPPAVRQAVGCLPIEKLLGDAAYDCEGHQQLCREVLGIRCTVIPINDRGCKGVTPTTPYRREMKESFPQQAYNQRWQAESVFSRFKRRLGSALRAHGEQTRAQECYLRVLTHNLMILLFLLVHQTRKAFYRAASRLLKKRGPGL